MTPHGPDTGAFVGASAAPIHDNPVFFDKGMAFMFETSYLLRPTLVRERPCQLSLPFLVCFQCLPVPKTADRSQQAAKTAGGGEVPLDTEYAESWLPLPKLFDRSVRTNRDSFQVLPQLCFNYFRGCGAPNRECACRRCRMTWTIWRARQLT